MECKVAKQSYTVRIETSSPLRNAIAATAQILKVYLQGCPIIMRSIGETVDMSQSSMH
jgi:hypothetical protein